MYLLGIFSLEITENMTQQLMQQRIIGSWDCKVTNIEQIRLYPAA